MIDTRQTLSELMVTCPDLVMSALEDLVEIDAIHDLFGVFVPAESVDADQSNKSTQALSKAINAITVLRMTVITAQQHSTPHFFQGGLTNDSEAA